jgi:hypothetical protein
MTIALLWIPDEIMALKGWSHISLCADRVLIEEVMRMMRCVVPVVTAC